MMASIEPIHPGEILLTEFIEPMGISQYRLAKDLDVPQTRIADIVKGRRNITADTALWLAKYLGMSDSFWVNLQAHYDLEVERDRMADELEKEKRRPLKALQLVFVPGVDRGDLSLADDLQFAQEGLAGDVVEAGWE